MNFVIKMGDNYATDLSLKQPFTSFLFEAVVFNKINVPDLRQVKSDLKCVPLREEVFLSRKVKAGTVGAILRMSVEELYSSENLPPLV